MRGLILLFSLFCVTAQAKGFKKSFVEVRDGQSLYVEYKEAAPGYQTLFLLNGLTWSTVDWLPMVHELLKTNPNLGIVLYDPEGMGQTLLKKAPITFDIPLEAQVRDLHDLIAKLNINGPISAAGLSYGGALAVAASVAYPEDFDQIILVAPFLQRLADQDLYLNSMVRNHRMTYPWDLRSDEDIYDQYLRILIYTTYPIPEPTLLTNPFKLEAVYRMVKGAKNFRAMNHVKDLGKKRLHIMGGEEDPYVKDLELQGFWQHVPTQSRASYLRVLRTKHKIPDEQPRLTARWTNQILSGHPALFEGRSFEIDPASMIARDGGLEIPLDGQQPRLLKMEKLCGSLLAKTR